MNLTTDKLRSLVRKWHTLIEAHTDVKTSDGYVLRLFCIGFTKRRPNQVRKTSYAQSSQIRQIRKKMIEIMQREANGVEMSALTEKFIVEAIGREIERVTASIYPLQNVLIRKVKVLKSPKTDLNALFAAHGGAEAVATQDQGEKVEATEDAKPSAAAKKKAAKKKGDE